MEMNSRKFNVFEPQKLKYGAIRSHMHISDYKYHNWEGYFQGFTQDPEYDTSNVLFPYHNKSFTSHSMLHVLCQGEEVPAGPRIFPQATYYMF